MRHLWSAQWYLRGAPQKHGPSPDLIGDHLALHGVYSPAQFGSILERALNHSEEYECSVRYYVRGWH